jgi:hypothetical protein
LIVGFTPSGFYERPSLVELASCMIGLAAFQKDFSASVLVHQTKKLAQ